MLRACTLTSQQHKKTSILVYFAFWILKIQNIYLFLNFKSIFKDLYIPWPKDKERNSLETVLAMIILKLFFSSSSASVINYICSVKYMTIPNSMEVFTRKRRYFVYNKICNQFKTGPSWWCWACTTPGHCWSFWLPGHTGVDIYN